MPVAKSSLKVRPQQQISDKKLKELLEEDKRRLTSLLASYRPITGENAPGLRFECVIEDFLKGKKLWLPVEMLKEKKFCAIIKCGSISAFCEKYMPDLDQEKARDAVFRYLIRLRCKHDFYFFAYAYAEKTGITIVKHYIDRAISAKTDNRPEFQQMIKDSDKKLFDIVLVWKLDRFARNRYDSARYKTQLKKNGVKLMSATEVISDGPEGIILESVLEGYAEYYSADLSEKVIRGMTENALKGKFSGGAIPFGYTINADRRFEIDPLTAPFVAETFQRYNDGQTMREIRDWLNEKGIKNKRGGPMSFNVIQHMLSNRRYIGELKYRDILIPDAIPPIVSVEIFNEVQEKMLKNKKAPARRKAEDDYLLTTKLFCGHCGALMFGESGTSRTGEVHRYYKCATAKKHKGCKKKTVRKQWLEDLVVNQTMQLVRDDAAMESIIAKVMELQNKENTNIPLYEKQLRDAESGIQNMLNAIQAGILTSSTKERLEQLEETKRELEARIAEEKLAKPKVTEDFIRFWLLRFRKLNMNQKDQRQALVDTFINSIYLYDDKVLITFNYKEGTQTIPFEKVEESKAKGNGSDFDCVTAPQKDSF